MDGGSSCRTCRIRVMEMHLLLLRAMYMQWSIVLRRGPLFHFHAGLGRLRLRLATLSCVLSSVSRRGGPAKLVAGFGLVGRQRASNAQLVSRDTPWSGWNFFPLNLLW